MKLFIRAAFLPVLVFLTQCSGRCTYEIFAEFPNTSHTYKVVKFYNWCGSTSSNNNNFSLLGLADSIDNRQRIIFVVNSTVAENLDQDTTVRIAWVSDSSVLITYEHHLTVVQKEQKLDGISINYAIK